MFTLSNKSKNNREGVDQRLIDISDRAIGITKIDFGIPTSGGFRTKVDQALLFRQNKSKCDGVSKMSNHQTGRALDFYAYVKGNASWQKEHLAQVAAAFLQAANELGIKIRWGGLFTSFTDMPHIELVD